MPEGRSVSTPSAVPSPSDLAAQTPTPTPTPTPTRAAAPGDGLRTRSPDEQRRLDLALIAAAWQNDIATARRLIDQGADVNAKDDTMQSAYLIATSEGYRELLELTLANGADVRSLDSYNGTGLIRAAERGHAWVVGRLIRAGIEVDHVNRLGWVGLHEALIFAKPDRPDDYRDTVRVIVAARGNVEIRAAGDKRSPIELARAGGLREQAELLAAAAAQRGVPKGEADRRLLEAAERGDADAAALALRAGADIETRNQLQQTALLLASANDRVPVARLLVALGADPDALDYRHDTPWLVTGVTGSVPMLEALLPARPDMTIKNRYGGLSPIPAAERGHVEYIRRVIRTGVDLDHVNDLGWTALLEAVVLGNGSQRYQEITRILVDAGVNTTIKDRQGRDALDHARQKGYAEIVAILESARR